MKLIYNPIRIKAGRGRTIERIRYYFISSFIRCNFTIHRFQAIYFFYEKEGNE